MEAQYVAAIVVAALASPVLLKVVEAIILKLSKKGTLLDRIEKEVTDIKKLVDEIKIDSLRTNILLLLSDYPDHPDIPLLAYTYVVLYNGNSYIVPLLCEWYATKGIAKPEWLLQAEKAHVRLPNKLVG